MRRFLIPLLMASAVLPATAIARERGEGAGAGRERPDEANSERSSEDRPQRAERAARGERPVRAERSERPVHVERIQHTTSEPQAEQQHVLQSQPEQQRVRRVRRSDGNLVDGFRAVAQDQQTDGNVEVRRGTGGALTAIPNRTVERHDRTSDRHRWSGDWRRDHRYDWRSHRSRHRTLFRLGSYYDPYGWGYRRFSIGYNLWPSYYGSSFWMNDPWQYRLPPAYGPYRWVRYYDDALLVNIYTGQVVDVLYSFFW